MAFMGNNHFFKLNIYCTKDIPMWWWRKKHYHNVHEVTYSSTLDCCSVVREIFLRHFLYFGNPSVDNFVLQQNLFCVILIYFSHIIKEHVRITWGGGFDRLQLHELLRKWKRCFYTILYNAYLQGVVNAKKTAFVDKKRSI